METYTRFVGFLPPGALDAAIGVTAIQVSGGGTNASNTNRQGILIVNPPTSTQTLYAGTVSSITSSGVHAIKTILPGQEWYLQADGTAQIWLVAAGASGGLYTTVETY